MNITRFEDARPYEAKAHYRMSALRLQGLEASDLASFSCSLSHFLPGGGAEYAASPNEKVYVVLSGQITVSTDGGEHVLGPLDSCAIGVNEARAIENRGNQIATILVVVSN